MARDLPLDLRRIADDYKSVSWQNASLVAAAAMLAGKPVETVYVNAPSYAEQRLDRLEETLGRQSQEHAELNRRLDEMQGTYLEHISEEIRRQRAQAYGVAWHIAEFSDAQLYTEMKRRQRS